MERDYGQVSTEEILERSGVSRGALYHHFPAKLDLFRAVFEASERRFIERVAAEASALPRRPSTGCSALARGLSAPVNETDEELRRIGLTQSQGRARLGGLAHGGDGVGDRGGARRG